MSMYRAISTVLTAGFGVALYCGQAFGAGPQDSGAKAPEPKVVFVCKYGSVKSLVAAETFNKLAEQRGLSLRAIGRAANPGTVHTEVHPVVVNGLAQDGIHVAEGGVNVADYKPAIVRPEEAAAAIRVVHISLQGEADPDSSVVAAASRLKEERWNDVPSMLKPSDANGIPGGEIDLSGGIYKQARAPLVRHIEALVDELARKQESLATR
jgi:hypothetical protein